jgi:glutamine transport system permease protein
MNLDWSVVPGALPYLLQGAEYTLLIAATGLAGGCVIGFLAGMARAYDRFLFDGLARLYIGLIRGTPLVVQVMFIYFALPILLGVRIDSLTAAIAAIVLNSGAYIAEIVRGALLSISKGLTEAGLAMGLPFRKVLFYIVGPLAFRRMLPALGNQCITSLKDTSLFIVIGVGELTRHGQEVIADTYRAVEIWTVVAAIYLVILTGMSYGLRLVEKRMPIL